MLQWDFSFSFGQFPLHHKQYKIKIFTSSITHLNSTQLLFGTWLYWICLFCCYWVTVLYFWFTSASIHLFTVPMCNNHICNRISGFIHKYIWVWEMSVHSQSLCSGACLHILYPYNLFSNQPSSVLLDYCTFFWGCLSPFHPCRLL